MSKDLEDNKFDMLLRLNNFAYIAEMIASGYDINKVREDFDTTVLNYFVYSKENLQKSNSDTLSVATVRNKIINLVDVGASVTAKDNNELSPLLIAMMNNDDELIEYFIEHAKKLDDLYNGVSVFDYAVLNNDEKTIVMLTKKAFDLSYDNDIPVDKVLNSQSYAALERLKKAIDDEINRLRIEEENN